MSDDAQWWLLTRGPFIALAGTLTLAAWAGRRAWRRCHQFMADAAGPED